MGIHVGCQKLSNVEDKLSRFDKQYSSILYAKVSSSYLAGYKTVLSEELVIFFHFFRVLSYYFKIGIDHIFPIPKPDTTHNHSFILFHA
jgi:hypothetical protein